MYFKTIRSYTMVLFKQTGFYTIETWSLNPLENVKSLNFRNFPAASGKIYWVRSMVEHLRK